MKKTFSYSLTVILILAIVLSGCGGKSDDSFSIAMSLIPAASTTSFPTGIDDLGGDCNTVNYPYYMAKYEVTYALWKKVYDWATDPARGVNRYFFENPGSPGGGWNNTTSQKVVFTSGHETDPVTDIYWREAMVWCNALTEYHNAKKGSNLGCVYKDTGGNIIRDSTNVNGCNTLDHYDHNAKGFRLPTSMEWELAARYIGPAQPTVEPLKTDAKLRGNLYWTSGSYVSGATAPYTNENATKAVAWYWDNSKVSSNPDIYSTQPVGQKTTNALSLFDMSGNVWEWCFDWYDSSNRVLRGGGWSEDAPHCRLGLVSQVFMDNLSSKDNIIGFRPVRTE